MSTPLFDLLKRNLAVPDVDRGMTPDCDLRKRRGMRPATIAGFRIAYRLHTEQGMNRYKASKQGSAAAGCSLASLYSSWPKQEARLREEGLL